MIICLDLLTYFLLIDEGIFFPRKIHSILNVYQKTSRKVSPTILNKEFFERRILHLKYMLSRLAAKFKHF